MWYLGWLSNYFNWFKSCHAPHCKDHDFLHALPTEEGRRKKKEEKKKEVCFFPSTSYEKEKLERRKCK